MKKFLNVLNLFCLILVANISSAQLKSKTEVDNGNGSVKNSNALGNKLMLSMDLDLGIFGRAYRLGASPAIGYRVLTPRLVVNVGPVYSYFRENSGSTSQIVNIYGGRAFLRYNAFSNFYAHAEYRRTVGEVKLLDNNQVLAKAKQALDPSVYLGVGYSSNFNNGLGVYMEILYDVVYRYNTSIYPNPFSTRLGISYGF